MLKFDLRHVTGGCFSALRRLNKNVAQGKSRQDDQTFQTDHLIVLND